MDDQAKKDIEKTLRIFDQFIDVAKQVNQFLPVVQKFQETYQWGSSALNDPNITAGSAPYPLKINTSEFWENSLSQITNLTSGSLISGSSIAVTAGSAIYDYLTQVGQQGGSATQLSVQTHQTRYQEIQERQQRIEEVRLKLFSLNPDRATEFSEAVRTCRSALTGIVDRKEAGNVMRNVLNHTQGDLYDKAQTLSHRQAPKSQRWALIADYLAINAGCSYERNLLLGEGQLWRNFTKNELTNITKNQERGVTFDLERVFTSWIDHLYKVLFLIDPDLL